MIKTEKSISVSEAAAIMGVTRSTVNNWIKTKKLYAERPGRNYSIPVEEICFFLKSTGREIPEALEGNSLAPFFKSYQNCSDYWKSRDHGEGCDDCVIIDNQIDICFTAKSSSRLHCSSRCNECSYYNDIYLPKIQFIHQINFPAAVCKGLFFWGVNSQWAKVSHVLQRDFPGTGIEDVVDEGSLGAVISDINKVTLGEYIEPANRVLFRNGLKGSMEAMVSFYPLNEPPGTFLLLAKPLSSE